MIFHVAKETGESRHDEGEEKEEEVETRGDRRANSISQSAAPSVSALPSSTFLTACCVEKCISKRAP